MGDSWVVRHKKKYRKRVEAESILIGATISYETYSPDKSLANGVAIPNI